MFIKDLYRKIVDSFALDCFFHWRILCKHSASIRTEKCREKMEYVLLRRNHIIEKGLSIRCPKNGFGKEKVKSLLLDLLKYKALYGNPNNFLCYPLATIEEYISYTKTNGNTIDEIETLFLQLNDQISFDVNKAPIAGVVVKTKEQIEEEKKANFNGLLSSRHSIRYFTKEKPSIEKINEALCLAQKTPSACNRQGWKVHIFENEKCSELLKWQGGSKGFEHEPTIAFLVTANERAFLKHEPFQAYVDGGMYSMTLLLALHDVGLGAIPLSCGFHHRKLSSLFKKFNIPENEIPIEIIAAGEMEDSFKIAASSRKNIAQSTIIHD